MPSEITAFLQAQTQTQTLQANNVSSDKEDSQPGLFDSFISEYASTEEDTTEQTAIAASDTHEDTTQLITFTGSNSFTQSVIDILAERNENENLPQEIPEETNDIEEPVKESGTEIQNDIQPEETESIIAKVKTVISEKISELKSGITSKNEILSDIEEIVTQILDDESIPEDTKNEIMKAVDELVSSLKDTDSDSVDDELKSFAVKISDAVRGHVSNHKVSAALEDEDTEDTQESEDTDEDDDVKTEDENHNAEAKIYSGTPAGLAVIQNTDPVHAEALSESESESESHSELPDIKQSSQQNVQTRNISHEHKTTAQKTESKSQNESENVKAESKFDEHLEISDNENKTSNENQNQNQNLNHNTSDHEDDSQENEQPNTTQNLSRTRNDNRRTSNTSQRTQNERTETNSHRTESRNTFQSFFEGVLNSRRSTSQSSPLPLNLRTSSYTFNQSQTLRDGLVNVVRFIRADGVQKANIVIDPPALGRISVELTSSSSGVEASIKVASEQIRQLVQDQLSELRMNLSQQGVQVAEFTVDVQQDNSQNGNHQGSQYGNERRIFAVNEADDEDEEFRIDLEEGLLYWVA